MRRKEREVTDINEIFSIIKKCDVCRIAFFADNYPYIIPMNFGATMEDNKIKFYFHCARSGTKLDLLEKNRNVAFEMDCSHELLLGEKTCDSSMDYESVCGNGVLRILPEEEKVAALTILMNHYQPEKKHEFDPKVLKMIKTLELTVDGIYGKRLKRKKEIFD